MVSDDARSLIEIFLSTDPSKRPTAEEATQHEFFGHINFETLRENEAPFVPELEDNMDTSYFDNRELHDLSLFLTDGEHHGGIYGESRKGLTEETEATEATSLVEEAVELDMLLEIGPLTISSPPAPPQTRRKSSNDAMGLDHILGTCDLPSSAGLTNGSDATTTTTTTTTTTAAAAAAAAEEEEEVVQGYLSTSMLTQSVPPTPPTPTMPSMSTLIHHVQSPHVQSPHVQSPHVQSPHVQRTMW